MARRLGHRQNQFNQFISNLVLTLIVKLNTLMETKAHSLPRVGIHVFKILKFAQFLHKSNITGIKEVANKKLGRNKISVDFISAEKAKIFLDLDILE
ncbi:unnamed protein product, partial [Leptidea sinapis]